MRTHLLIAPAWWSYSHHENHDARRSSALGRLGDMTSASAQTPAPAPAAAVKDPCPRGRSAYTSNRNYSRGRRKMPEELYAAQTEVRTFEIHIWRIWAHVVLASQGREKSNGGNDFEKTATKAALVKGLNDALTYCDGAYTGLTGASAWRRFASRRTAAKPTACMSLLTLNYGHNNEHYGNRDLHASRASCRHRRNP